MNPITKMVPAKLHVMLLDYWLHDASVTIKAPVSPDEISAFEQRYGVSLPSELKELLLLYANGFNQNNNYQDKNGFNFYPLHKIRRVTDFDDGKFNFQDASQYFIFCDYLDFCWAYAICLATTEMFGSIVIIGTTDGVPIQIAKNFFEFIELYLADDDQLYV